MEQRIISMIEKSPAWAEATNIINAIVDDYNKRGVKMTEEQTRILREVRLCATILKDKEIFNELTSSVYEKLKTPKQESSELQQIPQGE